jgi:FtsH-binding integral membrane protein
MNPIKKVVAYTLITLILVFTIIALLGIWDIIDLEQVVMRLIWTLIVIFAASAVVLFIFTVMLKDDEQKPKINE